MPRPAAAALLALALLTAACSGSGDDDPDGRTITHAMGTTQVGDQPVRVVVLDAGQLDAVAALGITPVGALRDTAGGALPGYIADALGPGAATIADTGTVEEPDLAAIAALRPDLILSDKEHHEALFGELSKLGPTVFNETVGASWKQDFLLAAQALNRTADAQRVLATYEKDATALRVSYAGRTAAAVLVTPDVRAYGTASFVGSVLGDAGLAQTGQTEFRVTPVPRLTAPLLFYAAFRVDGTRKLQAVTRTATWRALPAVKEGKAIEVPDEIWFVADGPVGAQLVLDDLQTYAERLAR